MSLAALLPLALLAGLPAGARGLTFDAAFAPARAGALHCTVAYSARGARHALELWRDGDRRLRRRTDGAVETLAFHEGAGPGYRMSVLDLRRKIHTTVDRTSLQRVGEFTEWFDLAYGLRHPAPGATLSRARAPSGAAAPVAPCDWYALSQGGRTTRVCWSARDHFPLLILGADGGEAWRVTALDRGPLPPDTFAVRDAGFVRNDADEDIRGD